eukprot:13175694-Ditylum_brightwellii.AAC.1
MYDLTCDDTETTISDLTNLTVATLGGEEESMTPTKLKLSNEGEDNDKSVITTMSAATNMFPVETEDT